MRHGDLSILSFHATKVFNTFEGGAIICHDAETKAKIDRFKNFGIVDESTIEAIGLNGKMSEINAAMGLAQLPYINQAINDRKTMYTHYHNELNNVVGLKLPDFSSLAKANYSYFPIMVGEDYGITRDELFNRLKEHNIFARKYFYPSITDFTPYKNFKAIHPFQIKWPKTLFAANLSGLRKR